MAETITFTAYLKDMMSGGLNKIGAAGVSAFGKLDALNSQLNKHTHVTTGSIAQLREAISNLEKAKTLTTSLQNMKEAERQIHKLQKELDKLENTGKKRSIFGGVSGSGSGMMTGLKGLAAPLMAGVGAAGVLSFGKSALTEYNRAAQADAQVKASIASTRGAAKLSFDELAKQAADLQKVTLFDDDATKSMQSVLLTFTKVKADVFKQAIPLIQDVATKMGGDLNSNAIQVGKALQDPIQGITALRRSGIQFSESQINTIKNLVETNQLAKAQAIILGELKLQVGGSAEAAARAGMGPLQILNNAFGDVKESIGELLQHGINKLLPAFNWITVKIQAVVGWMKEHSTFVKALSIGLGGLAIVIGAVTIATWLWNLALWANPLTWIVVGIGAVITALVYLWLKFEGFRKAIFIIWNFIKIAFQVAIKSIVGYFRFLFTPWRILWNSLASFRKWIAEELWPTIKKVFTWIGDIIGRVFGAIGRFIDRILKLAGIKTIGQAIEEGKKQGENKKQDKKKEDNLLGFDKNTPQADTKLNEQLIGGGVSSINGSSGGTKNINITIQKLVEKIDINTTNINEATSSMIDKIKDALLIAVNDANLAAN